MKKIGIILTLSLIYIVGSDTSQVSSKDMVDFETSYTPNHEEHPDES